MMLPAGHRSLPQLGQEERSCSKGAVLAKEAEVGEGDYFVSWGSLDQ